ncbi:hypothetical protein Aca07nite_71580 [Actinoplanes capillaceus]|uniref:Secreted protein n=1 Tax=Actinoplanes campanulatus TaxID=113559 RepID=A0ABQ3WUK4_9ACTN|nr:hypothetical protein [Actinoplanes capillaceus]GID49883.1 hypothetical protein Aca07nite_71580 [Actinoplanes capillaceus]
MNTAIKLGGFGAGLAAVFTAALGLGSAFPVSTPATPTPAAHSDPTGTEPARNTAAAQPPAGLQISQDGYRLTLLNSSLPAGVPQPFRFQITGPDERPVTDYVTSHDKDLHLIVVRRDLSGFQHLHPQRAADGTWSTSLTVPAAGQYRIFADFQPAGHEGLTLGADVPAAGDYQPTPLPATARTVTVDGYTVTLTVDLTPGGSSPLTLSVSKAGRLATDLQPYLGAYGHLVVLRDGDLAYLHVHPDGSPGDGRTTAGPKIAFHTEVPSAGAYRLYLDFQHDGKVRTAEFTAVTATPDSALTPTSATPGPSRHGTDGHTHD